MTDRYTAEDVTTDLAALLTLTKIFEADDKGFWLDRETKEKFIYKGDRNSANVEIVNFQNPMPTGNYLFFNPFSEGFGKKSPSSNLFYNTVRVAFNVRFMMVALFVAEKILESKGDDKIALDPVITRMASLPIDRKSTLYDIIDETMIKEFCKIRDRLEANEESSLFHVPYISQQMSTKVRCEALTDKNWDEKFGKDVRKKSTHAFKFLVMGVLGIKDPRDLDQFSVKYDSSLKTSARLYCTISTYLELYSRFNDVLSEEDAVDLGLIKNTIDNFSHAYAIAKHMIQPVVNLDPLSVKPADTSHMTATTGVGRPRFEANVVPSGQPVPQAPTAFGGGSRFRPHVVGESNGGYSTMMPIHNAPMHPVGTMGGIGVMNNDYFGGQQMGGYQGFNPSGLNFNPPQNIGGYGTPKTYF